jgi:hypothetical protein
VEEESVAHGHLAQDTRSEQSDGRRRASGRRALAGSVPGGLVEVAADVLGADQVGEIFDGGQVAEPARVDELRAVVGQDVVGVAAEDLVQLSLGLPDRDPVASPPQSLWSSIAEASARGWWLRRPGGSAGGG